ncbi:hypothetical protein ATPR_0092 [Acetobacter tropicalis NBRC 101654]|uniref:Uncharacterized protein n=1 Tax=Acetobacter tropicalis NBRC 101654 TaxID=749388 RepID=F7V9P3_9PROT|nr:hypothetical protein ATPR_0092 [Acetobacter tropicalis NBRC 101654]
MKTPGMGFHHTTRSAGKACRKGASSNSGMTLLNEEVFL